MEHRFAAPVGFWARVGANLLDGLLLSIPFGIIGLVVYGHWEGSKSYDNLVQIAGILYAMLVPLMWNGQTVGKRVIGARIVRVNGEPLGIGTMILRVIVAALVYGITFGVGLIVSMFMIGIREDKRGIHDFIAGTQVVSAQ